MSYHLWQNVILQLLVLIFRCQKVLMRSLHLWVIFWGLIGSQNISQLEFLKLQVFQDNPWPRFLIKLLDKYDLRKKKIAYVNDEGFNFNTMTTTFKSIVSCDILGLKGKNHSTCFDHAFFKAYQQVGTNEIFCKL